jgi:transitional endoplasmic reticulum ATPase
MNNAMLDHLESALRTMPDQAEVVAAYLEAARVAGASARAIAYLTMLGTPPELFQQAAVPGLTALLDDVRNLLGSGRRDEAAAVYHRLIKDNPALQDQALEAELAGKLVRIGERAVRETTLANDDTDSSEVRRLTIPERERVTFADVSGLDEVKTQIRRKIITPFQKPSLFQRFRKNAGGGVLLYGPPGCGKTLLARATAGECGAAFLNVAISDVLDLYIGESERKLHSLFEQARRKRPSVMFFDEVEALGGRRAQTREATSSKLVSQFLTELDGFAQNNEGVLVLAATNVPWAVDPAFRRPGRFDRVLFIPPPDQPARVSILRGLLAGRPTNDDIDVEFIARNTGGFSGADLREVVERAVDEAIDASIEAGAERLIDDTRLKAALRDTRPTTLEWLTTARNYARYANEGGQYDDVLRFVDKNLR